jgi:hypothetical protein
MYYLLLQIYVVLIVKKKASKEVNLIERKEASYLCFGKE